MSRRADLYVDACCWINLFATGRLEEVLTALPYRCRVSSYVADHEVLTVWRSGALAVERLSLRDLEVRRLVDVLDVASPPEIEALVRFAAHLDDGEASLCALAVVRGGLVATDDRKAIRVLGELAPTVEVVQTPQLLRRWAENGEAPSAVVREALHAVEERARFAPRLDAPCGDWWAEARRGGD